MKKPNIITISGKPGSGKSSTADKVAEFLRYTRYSAGDTVRELLTTEQMTLHEYNQAAEREHIMDERIDNALRELRTQHEIVIDSRLGFYWIPESFKVYLDLNMNEAAERIYIDAKHNQNRQAGGAAHTSLSHAKKVVQERMEEEQQRFQALYHVDPFNTKQFDLIINTNQQDPHTVAMTVIDAYERWLDTQTWKQESY